MKLTQKTWFLALVGFLVGMTIFLVVPRSWLFVDASKAQPGLGESDSGEVWACPMLCVKLDGPGTCPVCGMDLEKVEDTGDLLELTERERQLVELATEPVERRVLTHTIRSFGELTFNQRHVERISAWVAGRITRLFADTVYTDVRKNDHLFEIYSPELFAAQSEYLAARSGGGFGRNLVDSSREKLLLFGLTEPQVTVLEDSGEAHHTVVIHSPASGTIYDLAVREGDYVKEGTPLYTIADTGTLWLLFDAYEADLPWIEHGQDVEVTLEAMPGRIFPGTVEFIDEAVNEKTRTVKVRVVLPNEDRALMPGMFADVTIHATLGHDGTAVSPGLVGRYTCYMHPEVHLDEPGPCPVCGMQTELDPRHEPQNGAPPPRILSIPRSAVLDTGVRQLVYVMAPKYEQQGDDWVKVPGFTFEGREVTLGPRAGDYVAVVDGLKEGEQVVTKGNFLIDSQMELTGKPSLLHPQGAAEAADPHAGH